jgi:hypothetical protein
MEDKDKVKEISSSSLCQEHWLHLHLFSRLDCPIQEYKVNQPRGTDGR